MKPDFSRSSLQAADISTTARLKTSRPPGIRIEWSPAATVSADAGRAEPPAGMIRTSAVVPSAPSTESITPGSSPARRTTAPAPSPNRMQTVRSVMSSVFEMTSAPITRTVSAAPDSMNAVAVDIA